MSVIMGYDIYADLSQYYIENYQDLIVYGHRIVIIEQIAKALSTLHGMGLVHGNLMPDNILVVKAKRPIHTSVKLAAFTLSQLHDFGREVVYQGCQHNNDVDTFKAPEYWEQSTTNEIRARQTDDIFAFGLIIQAMLRGTPGEQLKPKVEIHTLLNVGLIESMQCDTQINPNLPVGQILHELRKYINPEACLIRHDIDDDCRVKTLKSIVNLATQMRAEDRAKARDILQILDEVKNCFS